MSNSEVTFPPKIHVEPGLYSLYHNSPVLSDIVLRYSDRIFHGHKIVLVSNSRWFTNALTKQFTEATQKEIKLHDDDPAALEGMFAFMYGVEVSLPTSKVESINHLSFDAVMFCLQLFWVADKYECKPLMAAVPGMVDTWLTKLLEDMSSDPEERATDTLTDVMQAVYEFGSPGAGIKKAFLLRLFAAPQTSPLVLDAPLSKVMTKVATDNFEFGRDLFLAMMERKGKKMAGGVSWTRLPEWAKVGRPECTGCNRAISKLHIAGNRWRCDHCRTTN